MTAVMPIIRNISALSFPLKTLSSVADHVCQCSDSFDLTGDGIARMQEFGRVKAHTHTPGRTGGDDRTGAERHRPGQIRDDIVDAEDQHICRAVLAKFPVDGTADPQPGREGKLIRRHDTGSHRRITVQALAQIPLCMTCLKIPCAEIIEDGVAENTSG